mmetsp:Transcript_16348/g.62016  ORF Transcript_16348/g.62016 Transcript_16348/m.62016 type:complete len:262 (+) Transcript_16348:812-1597(+)
MDQRMGGRERGAVGQGRRGGAAVGRGRGGRRGASACGSGGHLPGLRGLRAARLGHGRRLLPGAGDPGPRVVCDAPLHVEALAPARRARRRIVRRGGRSGARSVAGRRRRGQAVCAASPVVRRTPARARRGASAAAVVLYRGDARVRERGCGSVFGRGRDMAHARDGVLDPLRVRPAGAALRPFQNPRHRAHAAAAVRPNGLRPRRQSGAADRLSCGTGGPAPPAQDGARPRQGTPAAGQATARRARRGRERRPETRQRVRV